MPMKRITQLLGAVLLCIGLCSVPPCSGAAASGSTLQQGVNRGPITAPIDPELEKQSKNSLDVAKYYFYKRQPSKANKAAVERLNKAVEDRLREIIDINPTFAKMDEVYFLLGEVYTRLGDIEQAHEFYSRVVKEFPDSQMLGGAKKRLAEIEAQGKAKKEG